MKSSQVLIGILALLFVNTVRAGGPSYLVNWEGTIETYKIQVAASTTLEDAFKVYADLDAIGYSSLDIDSTSSPGIYYKVQLGLYSDRTEAAPVVKELKEKGYKGIFIITKELTENEGKIKGLNLRRTKYHQLINDTTSQTGLELKALYNTATSDIRNTSPESSLSYFREIVQRFPETTQAKESLRNLSSIYSLLSFQTKMAGKPFTERKEYLEASLEAMKDYLNKYPNSSDAGNILTQQGNCLHALALYQTPKLKKSAEVYRKVIDNYSQCTSAPNAHLQYAGVLFELAKSHSCSWDTVRYELGLIPILYPVADKGILARSQSMIAETYLLQNNGEKAFIKTNEVMELYSSETGDVALSLYVRGRALLQLGKNEEAFKDFSTIVNDYAQETSKNHTVWMVYKGGLWGEALYYKLSNNEKEFNTVLKTLLTTFPTSEEARAVKNLWGIKLTDVTEYLEKASLSGNDN
jgi:outer membrane protein assembly factor BamD (BamD/ComL family)